MATNAEELQRLIEIDIPQAEPIESQEISQAEKIQSQLKILSEDSKQDKIQKITITKEIFDEIRKSLQDTIKSMEKNPSIFSRVAEYWGELPLWQKIIGGVALTVPTLIIGIAAHIGFLLALCGVTAVTYAAGGVILDDHHKCSTSAVESLQKGIMGIADLLELTINALDIIRQQLAAEIKKFVLENEKLVEHIDSLSEQIDEIAKQVIATTKVNEVLGETKDELVAVSGSLKEGAIKQADLMKQNQEKLELITQAYSVSQNELAQKIEDMKKVKQELEQELNKAKSMVDTLARTVSMLSNTVIGEDQRGHFQETLDAFLKQEKGTFSDIAANMEHSGKQFKQVHQGLESTNQSYQELLRKQEEHINALALLRQQAPLEQPEKTTPVGELLSKNGIYATKPEIHTSEENPTKTAEFN